MMTSFQDYLLQHQISPETLTASEREHWHTQYKRAYARDYQRELRARMKRIEFVTTIAEYKAIAKVAQQYGEGVGVFSRKAALAYIDSAVFLPPNDTLDTTQMLVRRSANNINQIVKATHIQKHIDTGRLNHLVTEFRQIEKTVGQLYATPKIIFKPIHLIPNAH